MKQHKVLLLDPLGFTYKGGRLWWQEFSETSRVGPRAEGLGKGGGAYANMDIAWEPGACAKPRERLQPGIQVKSVECGAQGR